MTIAKLKDQLAGKLKDQLASKLKREDPPGPDERDATIEKLERAIAEERDHSATLRKTIDELHFKAEAQSWAMKFLQRLTDLGIAGAPRKRGAAREPLVSELEAKRIIQEDQSD